MRLSVRDYFIIYSVSLSTFLCTLATRTKVRHPLKSSLPPFSLSVGYAQSGLQAGSTMTGCTFVPVGGGDINIQDILPAGSNIDTGDVNIQTLNTYGQTIATYSYYLR